MKGGKGSEGWGVLGSAETIWRLLKLPGSLLGGGLGGRETQTRRAAEGGGNEYLIAVGAAVGSFVRVYPQVLDQMRLLAEPLVAVGAVEGTLVRVRPLVLRQRRLLFESAPAHLHWFWGRVFHWAFSVVVQAGKLRVNATTSRKRNRDRDREREGKKIENLELESNRSTWI